MSVRPGILVLGSLLLSIALSCAGEDDRAGTGSSGEVGGSTTVFSGPTSATLGEPACEPSGDDLVIETRAIRFVPDCISVPAETPFEITLRAKGPNTAARHNLAISKTDGTPILRGDQVDQGKSITYAIEGLAAGDYEIYCEAHPSYEQGTLFVR